MRRVVLVMASLGVLVACEPDMQVSPTAAAWMEWPAEVAPATPFPVLLHGYDDLPCVRREFVIAPRVDSFLVTFEPYFVHRAGERPCQTLASPQLFAPVYWDTTVSAPGLSATFSEYEMRANAGDIRTFWRGQGRRSLERPHQRGWPCGRRARHEWLHAREAGGIFDRLRAREPTRHRVAMERVRPRISLRRDESGLRGV